MGLKGMFSKLDALAKQLEVKRHEPLVKLHLGDLSETDRALVEAASAGDERALEEVRRLTDDPKYHRTWGNPAVMARRWLVYQIGGDDAVVRQAVWRQIDALNTDLGRDDAPPLERLAIARVVHNWLMVNALEAKACSFRPETKERAAVERALAQAERRYAQALRALAYVRKALVGDLAARIATVEQR